ncbi:hypothetical protein SSX86_008003 [Deinandra increscens subsp. villosa]|uniref:Uncharacterized protein n=1 Tax=Deinandra increscens subsp. villosa TaxID=3103831 RepID=A0AAP0DAH1_9ASTR
MFDFCVELGHWIGFYGEFGSTSNLCHHFPTGVSYADSSFLTSAAAPSQLNRNYSSSCIKASPKLNMKCFIMNHKPQGEKGFGESRVATETGMNGVIWRSMENVKKGLRISVITAVLLGLLFLYDHHQGRLVLAASGGAMGGSSFSSDSSSSDSDYYESDTDSWTTMKAANEVKPKDIEVIMASFVTLFMLCIFIKWCSGDIDTAKRSVLKLQVGLLGTGKSLQKDLNRIAESADTSTSKGLNYVLQESILALLRHPDYCILGYSSVDVKRSVRECEKRFNQLSTEERGKFAEETLVNINNIRKKTATSQSSNGLPTEYIVVTIIVAANGAPELPPIKSSAQLKKALQMLASIPSSKIMNPTFCNTRPSLMAITHFLLESNFNSSPLFHQTFHFRAPLGSFPTKLSCAHNIALNRNYSSSCIKASPKLNMKCFIMNHKPQGEKGFGESRVATETGMNGVIWRSMENVKKGLRISVITAVLLGLLFLYDHHQGRLVLAASGGAMGGSSFSSDSSSSDSDYYESDTDSWTTMKAANEVKPKDIEVIMASFVTLFMLCIFIKWCSGDLDTAKRSVLKLQVGLLGTGKSLQKDLNRIAESADTSTSKGLNYVLQESILALLRHPDYCILGYSSVDVKRSVRECEKRFNQLSTEERGKFDEETLVNVNNIRKKTATSQSSNGLPTEYIVVTIIVAANGAPELPPIKSSAQLKKALQMLASIPSSKIMNRLESLARMNWAKEVFRYKSLPTAGALLVLKRLNIYSSHAPWPHRRGTWSIPGVI